MAPAHIHVEQIKIIMAFNVFAILDFSTFPEVALHAHQVKYIIPLASHAKTVAVSTQS
jgi:hypothetical protein